MYWNKRIDRKIMQCIHITTHIQRKTFVYNNQTYLYRGPESNRHEHKCSRDFKSLVSTSFTTSAERGVDQIRTGEWWFCKPLPYHLATTPIERKKGFEPSTLTLATWCSTSWATFAYRYMSINSGINIKEQNTFFQESFMYRYFNDYGIDEGLTEGRP